MALRSSLGRLNGLSKSLFNIHNARHMVSVTTPCAADPKDIETHTGQVSLCLIACGVKKFKVLLKLVVKHTHTYNSSLKYFKNIFWFATLKKFEKDDYRLVRFIDKEKQVNERFAIDLIADVPPEPKKSRVVSCDGGGGPRGHPRVFINLVSY